MLLFCSGSGEYRGVKESFVPGTELSGRIGFQPEIPEPAKDMQGVEPVL